VFAGVNLSGRKEPLIEFIRDARAKAAHLMSKGYKNDLA
jgi:hypothetical protein